ncbi:MAG: tail fiber domain-containing protein [Candidatus Gastranaerophilales bacterium]|nr:tail fiber domain-containing protein [Candidatus Gastranaerophilales bacterium]
MSISNTGKKAFTLAETIMTLVIVGLVVTASIPIFTEKTFGPRALDDDSRVWRSCTDNNKGLCTMKPVAVNVGNPETTSVPYSFYANTNDFLITDSFNPIIYQIGYYYFVTKDKNVFFTTTADSHSIQTGSNNVIVGAINIPSIMGSDNVVIGNNTIGAINNSVIIGSGNTLSALANLLVIGNGNIASTPNSTVIGNSKTQGIGELLRIGDFFKVTNTTVTLFPASSIDTELSISGTTNATKLIKSDVRLKNLQGKYEKGLNEVDKLNPVEFYYNKDDKKYKQTGLIAQDVRTVFPEAVITGPDGYLMLDTMPVFYAMFNALKELDEKTKLQKKHNEELRKEINKIKVEMGLIEAPKETLLDKVINFIKRIFGIGKKESI